MIVALTRRVRVELVQNRAMRIILKVEWKTCTHEMRNELKLLTLLNRRRFFRFVLIFTILNCPEQLLGIFKFRRSVRSRELRDETLLARHSYAGAKDWNSLPVHIRQVSTIAIFKQTHFKYLLDCDNSTTMYVAYSFVSYIFSIQLG